MITLHHLNESRSIRTLWLLEEMGVPYEVKFYTRDRATHFAPESLKAIHPLGKSPVIELNGKVVAESGAITETLIERFAPHLAPAKESDEYVEYLQWLHFSESSAMLPPLLQVFMQRETAELVFLPSYARTESKKVFTYLNDQLENKDYLVGGKLSGADFMMFFVAEIIQRFDSKGQYPHIKEYLQNLKSLESWQRAQAIEARHYAK
ncbi:MULTISPECIES: glutathione S-transferase family protein [unclassified Pseudomonas]|uniref:glutathione S-transferase family protein n=1 Tax=unclassified Pseudomonas TaxID=196821 RepID=UPI000BA43BA1|nr:MULTISPECIES: glutathione S-transferase family protein [unclassified Pseudomonas]MCU1731932.1 glutathione S-transferase family protein [Pseudomonas sp. 20P_3.2_Bac4]MCU1744978.1 glutathione S-transferase family protein [Pseudomonas sp. 20P_3.2_Bac5]